MREQGSADLFLRSAALFAARSAEFMFFELCGSFSAKSRRVSEMRNFALPAHLAEIRGSLESKYREATADRGMKSAFSLRGSKT
jgi:hypothetical protein